MKLKIFLTAFCQVALISINTYLITHLIWIGIFFVSFAISLLWAYNVSKVALSRKIDKLIYAFGAGCGAITGLIILQYFLR
jgi:hypothetical protein